MHTPTRPKSVVVLPVPATNGWIEDETLVIVEDVPDDEDEKEDAARSSRSSSSSFSALALSFFLARRSVGRSKF
jgi:hypothetical protein